MSRRKVLDRWLSSSYKWWNMFERFTEESRQVVVSAQDEARALNHSYIGTEHLLLGLLREEDRVGGGGPLQSLGLHLEDVREDVRRLVGSGEEPPSDAIPFTPRAKKVLELALREALGLAHNWIGPEHILLGIARENSGVASRILLDYDADPEKIRKRVMQMMAPRPPAPSVVPPVRHVTRMPVDIGWLDGLGAVLEQLGRDIRKELGREPDVGDLLLTIACARATVAGQALQEMGIDLDAVWGRLERIRQQRSDEADALMSRLEDVRERKRQALEREAYGEAGQLRDEERDLTHEAAQGEGWGPEVLGEVRRRLGLSGGE
jgi:ATP-dependent Clp protease ATP-binding subunit ClpA